MRIEIAPRIIDDNNIEVRENDLVQVQLKDMKEPSMAIINRVDTTLVTLTFIDILASKPGQERQVVRPSHVRSMVKYNNNNQKA